MPAVDSAMWIESIVMRRPLRSNYTVRLDAFGMWLTAPFEI